MWYLQSYPRLVIPTAAIIIKWNSRRSFLSSTKIVREVETILHYPSSFGLVYCRLFDDLQSHGTHYWNVLQSDGNLLCGKKKETQISWGRYFQTSFLANLVLLKGSFNWRILFYFETSSLQSYGRSIEEFQPFSQCNWVRAKNAYRSFYNFCQSFVSTIFFLIKESFHHS